MCAASSPTNTGASSRSISDRDRSSPGETEHDGSDASEYDGRISCSNKAAGLGYRARSIRLIVASIFVWACGNESDVGLERPEADAPAGACAASGRVGSFDLTLAEGFTSVLGLVEDAVTPLRVPVLVDSEGDCRLYEAPTLFCDPACSGNTTCDAEGQCVAAAQSVSAGRVIIEGLADPVEMEPRQGVAFYNHLGELSHPGFVEGDAIALTALGEGSVEPFYLDAFGVAPIAGLAESYLLETGSALALSWTPPADPMQARVLIDLNIAQHGASSARIECEVADTGELTIATSLSDQLLASGFSGFPSIAVTRRSVDSTSTSVGCVELSVRSAQVLAIEIPGLDSCSDDDQCTPPETCQPDLTCG